MRKSDAFPTKFVATADLQGRPITLMIERITSEEIGDHDRKPVIYFGGMAKGLALNLTNWNSVEILYGGETDGWIGKQIELYPAKTDYKGEVVDCIRVRAPTVQINPVASGVAAPVVPQANPAPLPPAPPPAAPQGAPSDEDVVF